MAKILIVEDNALNMKLFNDLLEAHGFKTVKTSDGSQVIELVRTEMPDLILMDIQLPEISGLDLTRTIKDDDDLKSIPIIAVTAFAMKGDEDKIREGGCEGYISKPISVLDFIATIKQHLPEASASKPQEPTPAPAEPAPAQDETKTEENKPQSKKSPRKARTRKKTTQSASTSKKKTVKKTKPKTKPRARKPKTESE